MADDTSAADIRILLLCRACLHSFFIDHQSTRELRITSIPRDAAIQGRNVGGIKCNGPLKHSLGSVNLTANENKHHGEERTSFFCCSVRFRWSRHQPGYIQGGQEVGRDYLLLGIHYRRIRSTLQLHTYILKL
jgi:hypothetical protein